MIKVEINNLTKNRSPLRSSGAQKAVKLALAFSGLAKKIGTRPVSLGVHIISNQKMRKLNFERRGKDKATDVLSFPMMMWEDRGSLEIELGDIFLSPEYIKNAAKEEGVAYARHFQRLFVHGLVHLLGYDHQNEREYRSMDKVEKKVLAKLK